MGYWGLSYTTLFIAFVMNYLIVLPIFLLLYFLLLARVYQLERKTSKVNAVYLDTTPESVPHTPFTTNFYITSSDTPISNEIEVPALSLIPLRGKIAKLNGWTLKKRPLLRLPGIQRTTRLSASRLSEILNSSTETSNESSRLLPPSQDSSTATKTTNRKLDGTSSSTPSKPLSSQLTISRSSLETELDQLSRTRSSVAIPSTIVSGSK